MSYDTYFYIIYIFLITRVIKFSNTTLFCVEVTEAKQVFSLCDQFAFCVMSCHLSKKRLQM